MGDLDYHSLRHIFGTWLAINHVDLKQAQMLMRHADINMTANRCTDVTRLPVNRTLNELDEAINDESCTPSQYTERQILTAAVTNSKNSDLPSILENKGIEQDSTGQSVSERESQIGCSGWDRTSDQVINSHLLCH